VVKYIDIEILGRGQCPFPIFFLIYESQNVQTSSKLTSNWNFSLPSALDIILDFFLLEYASNSICDNWLTTLFFLATRIMSYVAMTTRPWSGSANDVTCVSVSAPSVWNSLSYSGRSAELLSNSKRSLKTELFDIASYRKREHSA